MQARAAQVQPGVAVRLYHGLLQPLLEPAQHELGTGEVAADAEGAAVGGGLEVHVGEDVDAAFEAGALELVGEGDFVEGVGVGGLRGEGC